MNSKTEQDLRAVRREYTGEPLQRSSMAANPIEQFSQWLEIANDVHPEDSTCMTLATAGSDGQPAARSVLLKHFDEEGFCWYSNSGSAKAQHLQENPQAALQFYWMRMNRQVRIAGAVEMLPRDAAVAYFDSRPVASKASAAASRQSQPVVHRSEIERIQAQLLQDHPDGDIPCPEDWCGYRLVPLQVEFWQGRENRLHDRFQYRRTASGWAIRRLAP